MHAISASNRARLRVAVVVTAVSAVVASIVAFGDISLPAGATTSTSLYAYADGAGTPSDCPSETTSTDGCSLAEAFSQAAAGDSVLLTTAGSAMHYVGTWTLSTSGTSAALPVTIEPAAGVDAPVLDGNNSGRILDLTAGVSVTITGLTFANGQSPTSGGAIDTGDGTAGGTVVVSDSTFTGNVADAGGAIANGNDGGDGTLVVSGSTFSGNGGNDNGAAIANGALNGAGTVTVSGSTFTGNTADEGGAISNGAHGGNGTMTISASTFTGNKTGTNVAEGGGAIANGYHGDGTLSVSDSTFTGNTAPLGAAINSGNDSGTGTVFVAGNLFDDGCDMMAGSWTDAGFNATTDASCWGSGGPADVRATAVGTDLGTLTDNGGPTQTVAPKAGNPALALVTAGTSVTLNSTSVQLCPRTDQRGVASVPGARCAAGAVSPGQLFAYADGAGTPFGCPSETMSSEGCSLAQALSVTVAGDSVLLATAGSVSHYAGNWTLGTSGTSAGLRVTIAPASGVEAPVLDGNLGKSAGCSTASCDGPILAVTGGASVTITGLTFTGASTTDHGGAIDTGEGTIGGTVVISDSTFTGNSAHDGGAIANGIGGGVGKLTVSDSTFIDNSALDGGGGAIANGSYGGGGTVTVSGSTFTANRAMDGGAISNGYSGSGSLTASDSTFNGNSVTDDGGAINNGFDGDGTVTVSDSTFSGNHAGPQGGAIVNGYGGSGTLSVSGSTFTGNTASSGQVINSGNHSGTGAVFVAADLFDGGCALVAGAWTNAGYNAGTDVSCLGGGKTTGDATSTDVGTDLGTLADNGGPTQTVAPTAGNPAIGRVPSATSVMLNSATVQLCPRTDQRGVASASGTACDAGAVESAPDLVSGSAAPSPSTVGQSVTLTATVSSAVSSPSLPVPAGTVTFSVGATTLCTTGALSDNGSGGSSASCATTGLPAGANQTVQATYASTNGYAGATSTFTESVLVASAVTLSDPPRTVFGQPLSVTATVTEADAAAPAGSVQFRVDGADVGAPVAVGGAGTATSPALTDAGGQPLTPGAHAVSAVFTPADPGVHEASTAPPVTAMVDPDGTTTALAVSADRLVATVAAVAPGTGTPSGSVSFAVDGATVGTVDLSVSASGAVTATLSYAVPTGHAHALTAVYDGDSNFTGSSASTARDNPTITAHVASRSRPRHGWYRQPVTVSFTCQPHGSPLTAPCPSPVHLARNGAAQTVTRTITAADGGVATATVTGIAIDRTRPQVSARGVRNGGVYYGRSPSLRCVGRDAQSGLASCVRHRHVTVRSHRGLDRIVVHYRVTARDVAGNVRSHAGHYTVLGIYLRHAAYRHGAFLVRPGHSYTLVVTRTRIRPRYLVATPAPNRPNRGDYALHAAGRHTWTIKIGISSRMSHYRTWLVGVRIGNERHLVRLRVA